MDIIIDYIKLYISHLSVEVEHYRQKIISYQINFGIQLTENIRKYELSLIDEKCDNMLRSITSNLKLSMRQYYVNQINQIKKKINNICNYKK